MKATTAKHTEFTPCSMTITFESQEELDAWSALFNSSWARDAIIKVGGDFPSYHFLPDNLGSSNHKTSEFNKALRPHS